MIWKLLRQHISIAQMVGFSLANLCGMIIVLLSIQFYNDIYPILTQGDSFIKKDFIIVSKKVSTLGSLVGKGGGFTPADIAEIKEQPFTKSIGDFTTARFKVSAGIGMKGFNISTAMFFESVPDEFVDIDLKKWTFDSTSEEIPIIVPKNYLNLYNFGFAQSRNMPQLSEGMIGMIGLKVNMRGRGQVRSMTGRIVGFSNRLNTILVPEAFMKWANGELGEGTVKLPSRLIVEVNNPADDNIAKFFKGKGYETEDDKLNAGKTTWFLKVVLGIVLAVGLLISILSFYILMLSVYLLLQKNTTKIENLLLMGFSPNRVALPYQLLTIVLNTMVFLLGMIAVVIIRNSYLDMMADMMGGMESGGIGNAVLVGIVLLALVSVINILVIRKKIMICFFQR